MGLKKNERHYLVPIQITKLGLAVVQATSAKKAVALASKGEWLDVLPDDDCDEHWEVTGEAMVEP